MAFMCSSSTRNISTHTSRVGCDLFSVSLSALSAISTHTSRVGCDADLIARPALVCISTHTSRVGCDKGAATIAICLWISTHTSRVGCDNARHFVLHPLCNFYSHIPCGMWQHLAISCTISSHFYSHIPCGMWLLLTFDRAYGIIHFYSHIPCGMWLLPWLGDTTEKQISTHTSRVGCDQVWTMRRFFHNHFYSHIPCGMWPHHSPLLSSGLWFLLTHPVWDVTITSFIQSHCIIISTHTSRVGCDETFSIFPNTLCISTHTSRVGCDKFSGTELCFGIEFLLTHPVWDVTSRNHTLLPIYSIFLLTHPVWDVTRFLVLELQMHQISTHTSRVGCDAYSSYMSL